MLHATARERKLAEEVPDHLGHDLYLFEALAVVDLEILAHHIRHNYHIPDVGSNRVLVLQARQEILVILDKASFDRSALPRW